MRIPIDLQRFQGDGGVVTLIQIQAKLAKEIGANLYEWNLTQGDAVIVWRGTLRVLDRGTEIGVEALFSPRIGVDLYESRELPCSRGLIFGNCKEECSVHGCGIRRNRCVQVVSECLSGRCTRREIDTR